MGRCSSCGAEYFLGASDCPRCNSPVAPVPVELVEGAPRSAHVVGAVFALFLCSLGLMNVCRAVNGLPILVVGRRTGGWYSVEHDGMLYWFFLGVWCIVVPVAAYMARRHFLLGLRR